MGSLSPKLSWRKGRRLEHHSRVMVCAKTPSGHLSVKWRNCHLQRAVRLELAMTPWNMVRMTGPSICTPVLCDARPHRQARTYTNSHTNPLKLWLGQKWHKVRVNVREIGVYSFGLSYWVVYLWQTRQIYVPVAELRSQGLRSKSRDEIGSCLFM